MSLFASEPPYIRMNDQVLKTVNGSESHSTHTL